jgi:hypothetical protein
MAKPSVVRMFEKALGCNIAAKGKASSTKVTILASASGTVVRKHVA